MDDDSAAPAGDLKTLTERAGRTAWQTLRFGLGVLVGILLLPGLALVGFAVLAVLVVAGELREGPREDVVVNSYVSSGAEMPVRNAGRIVWVRSGEVTHQTCRGACDDLLFVYTPARAVEVRGADGRVVIGREPPWPLRAFLSESRGKRPQLKRVTGVPS